MATGDWGLGTGDWGVWGERFLPHPPTPPNAQCPMPNAQQLTTILNLFVYANICCSCSGFSRKISNRKN
ncbi:hypothetical protein H6G98_13530 [Nostoc sp. FACHB-857]|nr:hypothetical protein [Nostoc sp. FACHB-857]